jgi:putative ubiquitin-RnfH superfamily antitoxin RatB of RatAB toxin-antitoxin module
MAPVEATAPLSVEVACGLEPGSVRRCRLRLPAGASVRDALEASGLVTEAELAGCAVGVWGKLKALGDLLRDEDRVEVYRPLQVDPKEARRLRHRTHRSKAAR